MKIEKNAEGSYVLTCCFGELLEIHSGLRCSARIESHVKPELLDKKERWPIHFEHDSKVRTKMADKIMPYLGNGRFSRKYERFCSKCAAPFNEGDPLCKK